MAKRYIVTSLILFSFYGCVQPTDFNNSQFFFQTPEEVVENLALSYEQKNLEQYLSSFTADSKFSDGPMELWGKANESRIHQTMFASAENIDLQIKEFSAEATSESNKIGIYNYSLRLVLSTNEELLGQGRVKLEFIKNKPGGWQINSFRETKYSLRKSSKPASEKIASNDSVNYFPLRVGNEWVYEEQLYGAIPNVNTIVMDSVIIRGNIYFSLRDFLFPWFMQPTFLRMDTLQQLHLFVVEDSTDLSIFNFKAEIGQTLSFIPPGQHEIALVKLLSKKDSVQVPAGIFKNVLKYSITDRNSGSAFLYEFAENIGMVITSGTNEEYTLRSAYVNGDNYPNITNVESHYFDWTQIKSKFVLK